MKIILTINGEKKPYEIRANTLLMDLLRQYGYYSVKHGCETGECGSCAVLLGGDPINSCIMLAAQAHRKKIVTLEGIGTPDNLHPLQQAFIDQGAIQCGYCTPGMILSAKALIDKVRQPSEAMIRDALAGNLCRCTGYVKPVEAILSAAEKMRRGNHGE
jgi:aerobic-type carbon monoxide dehydrogenase small subunit (CoxS/CutS family)